MTLGYILLATFMGGVVSVLLAAVVSLTALSRLANVLVSFSVGTMLAVALLDVLPEVSQDMAVEQMGVWLLAGLFVFFALEKFTLWRHDHEELDPGHDAHHHPAGAMVMMGDTLHNFVDGVMIAAAFLQDTTLGIGTALAVLIHEIPQEVGDFMVLLHAGYTRKRALWLNALSSLMSVVGGLIGYFAFKAAQPALPYVLAFAAAGFLYIAVADLIPNLHRRFAIKDALSQVALIAIGVAIVTFAGHGH